MSYSLVNKLKAFRRGRFTHNGICLLVSDSFFYRYLLEWCNWIEIKWVLFNHKNFIVQVFSHRKGWYYCFCRGQISRQSRPLRYKVCCTLCFDPWPRSRVHHQSETVFWIRGPKDWSIWSWFWWYLPRQAKRGGYVLWRGLEKQYSRFFLISAFFKWASSK